MEYRTRENNIDKIYDVKIDKERLLLIRQELINTSSIPTLNTLEVDEYNYELLQQSENIRIIKTKLVSESGIGLHTFPIYKVNYEYLDFPLLVSYIDLILNGILWPIESIKNRETKSYELTRCEALCKERKDIRRDFLHSKNMASKTIKEKRERLHQIRDILNYGSITLNDPNSLRYYEQVLSCITLIEERTHEEDLKLTRTQKDSIK